MSKRDIATILGFCAFLLTAIVYTIADSVAVNWRGITPKEFNICVFACEGQEGPKAIYIDGDCVCKSGAVYDASRKRLLVPPKTVQYPEQIDEEQ